MSTTIDFIISEQARELLFELERLLMPTQRHDAIQDLRLALDKALEERQRGQR